MLGNNKGWGRLLASGNGVVCEGNGGLESTCAVLKLKIVKNKPGAAPSTCNPNTQEDLEF